jgi:LAO/AO transport system kinase
MSLVERVLTGDRLSLARLLTAIESGDEAGENALDELYPYTGNAHLVGVTGSTGTGKSTLVNQLTRHLRQVGLQESAGAEPRPLKVGIVAVDPTSPFTGGAILGDRIRMRDLAGDPEVFIRSMATRGALGGLAERTRPVVQALDAAGFDLILIETVGAGQSEVEIARTAHTTIVVDAPGLGDEVQAIKAGILEIADILVLNKADLPGAERAFASLQAALRLGGPPDQEGAWSVPLIQTVATEGDGVPTLAEALARHHGYLTRTGERERRERSRVEAQLDQMLRQRLKEHFLEGQPDGRYQQVVERVLARQISPQQAIVELMEGLP